ncbi:uncharacterized protein LOC125946744 [Dermacentor silvarum]|uniref:uncharacterized protein LOC125946744 n=1 Tax=Dermacentor silvarum TaxID=543639 RepID=UPI0021016CB2|nr:uncharacterized protein LOC125946744 [Dermacentor silvarum]
MLFPIFKRWNLCFCFLVLYCLTMKQPYAQGGGTHSSEEDICTPKSKFCPNGTKPVCLIVETPASLTTMQVNIKEKCVPLGTPCNNEDIRWPITDCPQPQSQYSIQCRQNGATSGICVCKCKHKDELYFNAPLH